MSETKSVVFDKQGFPEYIATDDVLYKVEGCNMTQPTDIQQQARELAEKVLKHVRDSYHPENVWFTNVTPILTAALEFQYRQGREQMREEAAMVSDKFADDAYEGDGYNIADKIRTIPIEVK